VNGDRAGGHLPHCRARKRASLRTRRRNLARVWIDAEEVSTWARRLLRRATVDRMREAGRPDPFIG
jgi:hypothetical protein